MMSLHSIVITVYYVTYFHSMSQREITKFSEKKPIEYNFLRSESAKMYSVTVETDKFLWQKYNNSHKILITSRINFFFAIV